MYANNHHSIDYLVIGHITQDLVDGGVLLGGTASYASLTALALNNKTALVTSCPKWMEIPELNPILVHRKSSQYATTFENIDQGSGRQQFIHHCAAPLGPADIPHEWLQARIVHLGPVAAEIDADIMHAFPKAFLGITPQGWMRAWGSDGQVRYREWPNAMPLLERADAIVLSIEDIQNNEALISEYAHTAKVLAVTEGFFGARIYWNGDCHHISAPKVESLDATGAGDIFAAVFFSRLFTGVDPWLAGESAVRIASQSVTRMGLRGIPTTSEIQNSVIEVIQGR